jgi:GST-like protein
MIDLYYYPSPNTWKVSILLEETGLPYRVVPVDIMKGEQSDPAFLDICPNGRVPAIVDQDAPGGPQPVFESGAILVYLADKAGQFLAPSGRSRIEALKWVFWQVGGLGPMAGQAHYFRRYQPDGNEQAAERFVRETARLYGVLDKRLEGRQWIAGDYGIADMACWGWVWFHRMHGQTLDDFPEVARWFFAMAERPAVERARKIGIDMLDPEARSILEGPYYNAPVDFAADKTLPK